MPASTQYVEVHFLVAPDFEAPGDADGNNTYEFTLAATDTNGLTGQTAYSFAVIDANDAPVAGDDTLSGDEDTTVSGAVTSSDQDGDPLTFAKSADPSNGSVVVATDGSFTYTPNPDFNGTDSFDVTADDGNGGLGTATITIDVLPINDAPVVDALFVSGNDGTVITAQATAVDVDGDPLTFTKGSDPANGAVVVNPDGSFAYTPNAGFAGPDSFTIVASDGNGGSDSATVSLSVIATPKVGRYTDGSLTTLIQTYQDLATAVADATSGQGIRVLEPTAIGSAGGVAVLADGLTISGNVPYEATFVLDAVVSDIDVQGNGPANVTGNANANAISGSGGGNVLSGEGGNDTLLGSSGADTLIGGADNDSLLGDTGTDTIDGGDGDDRAFGGGGDDSLIGGLGNDYLNGGNNLDTILGGEGNDTLVGSIGKDSLEGGAGDDILTGGNANDTLVGGDGNDTLRGFGEADSLVGGSGADTLTGGASADTLHGGDGDDSLDGGAFNDQLLGAAGNDTLLGGSGLDLANGGAGDDQVTGGSGRDTLLGGTGADTVDGGIGNDVLFGDDDADSLLGGTGKDTLDGGSGADTVLGGSGSDRLVVKAGEGGDALFGEAGLDSFDFESGFGTATIMDFVIGQDSIDLVDVTTATAFGDLTITYFGGGTLASIDAGGGDVLTVEALTGALSASDFVF